THPVFESDRLRPERQGAGSSLIGVDIDPSDTGQMLVVADLAAQQLNQKRTSIVIGDSMHNPVAAATALEAHHQPWLRRRASPSSELDAERAMPAMRDGTAVIGRRDCRLPNQRTIGEDPKCAESRLFDESVRHRLILRSGEIPDARIGSGIRLMPLTP